jgi:hypothetical protein
VAAALIVVGTGLGRGGQTPQTGRLATGGSRRPDPADAKDGTGGSVPVPDVPAPGARTPTVADKDGTVPVPTTVGPEGASGVLASPAVERALDATPTRVTAAVYDLSTGTTSLWHPGVAEYTASIVKVDILETLLDQAQAKRRALDADDEATATAMIEQSDDDSATDLWDEIGQQGGLNAFDRRIGLTGTVAGTDGHWGGTMTTAEDQIRIVRNLVQPSRVLTPASRAYELGLMKDVVPAQAWGVSSGPTTGVTVALKNGWLPLDDDGDWQVNSIGWIDGAGRDYILAVLTNQNATEAEGIQTIESLSTMVWDAMAPAAPASTAPVSTVTTAARP